MASVHVERKRLILEAHPSVARLQGHDPRSKYICAALVFLQTSLAVAATRMTSPYAYVCAAYFFGATLAQALFLAVHELTHDLFFASSLPNRVFSVFANLPVGVPFAISFRFYHLLHHRHLDTAGLDTDLPSEWEQRWMSGRCGKAIWVALQICAYALRPPLTLSEGRATLLHALNWTAQAAFDVALVSLYGWSALRFLLLSVLFAGGLHPCAGHFLAEHHPDAALQRWGEEASGDEGDAEPQNCFSYYGPLNRLTWNVGYHCEHHAFPAVPWSRLPLLRAEAAPVFDRLKQCPSWSGALLFYVFRSAATPAKRHAKKGE